MNNNFNFFFQSWNIFFRAMQKLLNRVILYKMEENITLIISPEYLYLVIVGNKTQVDLLVKKLNSHTKHENYYYSIKSHESITELCNNLNMTDKTKHVVVDDGVESAQTYSYVDRNNDNLYMLIELVENEETFTLGFPKLSLKDYDPETQIETWFKTKVNKIPKGIFKNLKIITIVGTDSNILVMSTRIAKKHNLNK